MFRSQRVPQNTRAIEEACACLFTTRSARAKEFYEQLNLDAVKRAYRAKALRSHPDRLRSSGGAWFPKSQEDFIRIHDSYRILCAFLKERDGVPVRLPLKKVIAVGGSKGGVGKSLFSANLGVVLAAFDKKVVVIDLDLGGANLHLYLNQVKPRHTLNDFLEGRTASLDGVLTPTCYGPYLIAGGNRALGLRQVTFSQKINIIKSIRNIKADYVILDLGGDASFNTLDFFNAADYGIVVSICDPAAYLETINFTRAAFYRHLLRAFAPESSWQGRKQESLVELIDGVVGQGIDHQRSMWTLVQKVKTQQPQTLDLLREIVGAFNVKLILNEVIDDDGADAIAAHIVKAARKILFVAMTYLGQLPFSEAMAASARSFIPVACSEPAGQTAREIKTMLSRLDP